MYMYMYLKIVVTSRILLHCQKINCYSGKIKIFKYLCVHEISPPAFWFTCNVITMEYRNKVKLLNYYYIMLDYKYPPISNNNKNNSIALTFSYKYM